LFKASTSWEVKKASKRNLYKAEPLKWFQKASNSSSVKKSKTVPDVTNKTTHPINFKGNIFADIDEIIFIKAIKKKKFKNNLLRKKT